METSLTKKITYKFKTIRKNPISIATQAQFQQSAADTVSDRTKKKPDPSTIQTKTNETPKVDQIAKEPNVLIKNEKSLLTPIISEARFRELKYKAEKAIRNNKTFVGRCQAVIRSAYLNRDWIELLTEHLKQNPTGKSQVTYEKICGLLPEQKKGESQSVYVQRCEKYILSRLIEHKPVAAIWSLWRNKLDSSCKRLNPSIMFNKLITIPFGTKGGLLRQLQNLKWVAESDIAEVNFPRSYNSAILEEMFDFVENYRCTACVSFLKFVVEKSSQAGWMAVFGNLSSTQIPFTALEMAIKHCYELLNYYSHNDIDFRNPTLTTEQEWDTFFGYFRLVTEESAQIRIDRNRSVEPILKNAQIILESIKQYWPQYDLDGYRNLWIVKPSFENCGRGLEITNNLNKIQSLVSLSNKRYVLQKYIERPLLIHNTKFDIRQWFLVSSVQPLIIWMFKENYLRFSTQVFSLTNLHESVHLTNNCIQRKYTVNAKRDQRLPQKNMWDCHTFQAYLRQIGKGDMYYYRIYSGIKKALIGTMLSSQNCMSQSANTFELFGADFMITEDMTPWLIEINSCPDLSCTNHVTARLVPRLVEDALKGLHFDSVFTASSPPFPTVTVIFDQKLNADCNTGNFEKIYDQSLPVISSTKPTTCLRVKGTEIPSTYKIRREMYDHMIRTSSSHGSQQSASTASSSNPTVTRNLSTNDASWNLSSHFEDVTNDSKMSTYDKLQEITKTLNRVAKGS